MNQEIANRLSQAAEVWGVEVTRTEILDVLIDERKQKNLKDSSLMLKEKEELQLL